MKADKVLQRLMASTCHYHLSITGDHESGISFDFEDNSLGGDTIELKGSSLIIYMQGRHRCSQIDSIEICKHYTIINIKKSSKSVLIRRN